VVLRLEVNDQLQTKLEAPTIHPKDTAKILLTTVVEIIFSYLESLKETDRSTMFKG
jgi:hypothetical protein